MAQVVQPLDLGPGAKVPATQSEQADRPSFVV
jgi:hypothetical protein